MTEKQIFSLLIFVCLFLVGYRFMQIEQDPLYPPSPYEGVEFTDEGWYSKAAQTFIKTGTFHHPKDFNFYSHTPVFSIILVSIYQIFGIGILQSRMASLIASLISLIVFYRLCRETFSRAISALACFLVLMQFENFNYSKLAILEPIGTTFALLSLGAWVCIQNRIGAVFIALTLSIVSIFVKTSLIFTFETILILCLWEAYTTYRRKEYRQSLYIVLLIFLSLLVYALLQTTVALWAGDAWKYFQEIKFTKRVELINGSAWQVIHNQTYAIKLLFLRPSFTVILLLGIIGIVLLIAERMRGKVVSRSELAMAIWTLSGIEFFGIFPFPLLNYYYFLVYPLTYLSFVCIFRFPQRVAPAFLLAFCFLQIAIQFPLYWQYNSQRRENYISTAKKIAQEMHKKAEKPIVMGPIASFISLVDPTITPVESYYPQHISQEERISYWNPQFLVIFQGEAKTFADTLSEKLTLLGRYQVLNHDRDNVELYEVDSNR